MTQSVWQGSNRDRAKIRSHLRNFQGLFERVKKVHALDRAATLIGHRDFTFPLLVKL
jgi:hypothetical protein